MKSIQGLGVREVHHGTPEGCEEFVDDGFCDDGCGDNDYEWSRRGISDASGSGRVVWSWCWLRRAALVEVFSWSSGKVSGRCAT